SAPRHFLKTRDGARHRERCRSNRIRRSTVLISNARRAMLLLLRPLPLNLHLHKSRMYNGRRSENLPYYRSRLNGVLPSPSRQPSRALARVVLSSHRHQAYVRIPDDLGFCSPTDETVLNLRWKDRSRKDEGDYIKA